MVEEESLRVVRCGGSELNFRRAVFSADSKYGALRFVGGTEGRESRGVGGWGAGIQLSGASRPASGRTWAPRRGARAGDPGARARELVSGRCKKN